VEGLVHALSDQSSGVRQQAAWALGAIGDPRALSGLLPSLKDSDAGVRKQAAWAIGAIGK
jgi:HEAT repeat protein